MQTGYRTRLRRATWLAFAIPAVVGLGGSQLVRAIGPGEHFWLVFPLLLAGCGLALLACVPWWSRLDDMQKHSHMVSWYWGGLAGGVAAVMLIVAATGPRSPLSSGAAVVMMGQLAGFLLFLAAWKWRRRGAAE